MSDDWTQFTAHAQARGIDLGPFVQMVRSATAAKRDEVAALAMRLFNDGRCEDEVVMASIDFVLN